jgi:putative membrane protein insertion efficiency factor
VWGSAIFMRQIGKLVVLGLLRGYKFAISPMVPPACRFVPTCSEYAMEAVERYGAVRGGLMALGRVLRCHPLARGGYDPVVKRQSSRLSPRMQEMGHPAVHEHPPTSPSSVQGAI